MLVRNSALLGLLLLFPVLSFAQGNNSSSTWPMYNHDALGSRFNSAENSLKPQNVTGLSVKWTYPTTGDVVGTPAVTSSVVAAGDTAGWFYALNTKGKLLWKTHVNAGIWASALITDSGVVVFGDLGGTIYGLDLQTGTMKWSVRPNPHQYAAIFGSATQVNGSVVIGISSTEEGSLEGSSACCTFRGSVVSIDPSSGAVQWQTYFITPAQQAAGSSGASVWSTPTFDSASHKIYVTTSNNYSGSSPTPLSDAFVALDAGTGSILWSLQPFGGDSNYFAQDWDFSDSPQIYTLANGEKVVGAGNKNGVYYVADAATGSLVSSLQVTPTCAMNQGLFSDSGAAYGLIFVNGTDCSLTSQGTYNPENNYQGVLAALSNGGAQQQWRFTAPKGAALTGVAIANGMVFFHSNGATSTLYALNAQTGAVLAAVATGGSASGPAVANGRVYVGTGVSSVWGNPSTSSIISLGP